MIERLLNIQKGKTLIMWVWFTEKFMSQLVGQEFLRYVLGPTAGAIIDQSLSMLLNYKRSNIKNIYSIISNISVCRGQNWMLEKPKSIHTHTCRTKIPDPSLITHNENRQHLQQQVACFEWLQHKLCFQKLVHENLSEGPIYTTKSCYKKSI